jgi:hypothetical protein
MPESASEFRVLLVAGPPGSNATDRLAALDWQDAIVACVSAVLERGGTIVMPASPELALIVAHASLPFTLSHTVEYTARQSPIEVHETGEKSGRVRRDLAPFARLNTVAMFDSSHQRIPIEPLDEGPTDVSATRIDNEPQDGGLGAQSLLEWMPGVIGVVLVHPTGDQAGPFGNLTAPGSPSVVAVWPTSEDRREVGTNRQVKDAVDSVIEVAPALERMRDGIPFAFVFEVLLDRWLGGVSPLR